MKNLALEKSEKLEDLANRARMRQDDNPARGIYGRYHNRNDYPWKRVWRFISGNVGKNWDEVYSKYCKLDWIPTRYKTIEQISHNVILNTFYRDGGVWYYDKYTRFGDGGNEKKIVDVYRETFYIHPKTKILYRQQPKHGADRKKQFEAEEAKIMRILGDYHQLLKLNGIWHEVKGEPVKSDIIEVDGLHYRLTNLKVIKKLYVHGGIEVETVDFPKGQRTDGNYKIIDGKVYIPSTDHKYCENKIGPKDRLIEDLKNRSAYYWQRLNYNGIKITLRRQLNSKELKKYGLKNDSKILNVRCKKCGGIVGKDCIFHVCDKCGKYLREDCKCYPWR